ADAPAAALNRPGGRRVGAEEQARQLRPSRADEPGEPEDLACVELEGHPLDGGWPRETDDAQERSCRVPGRYCRAGARTDRCVARDCLDERRLVDRARGLL